MIHSLAGELGLDVYIVSLSRAGLDDTSLSALISELPEQCIALMEDIDAAFMSGITRDMEDEEDPKRDPEDPEQRDKERDKDKTPVAAPVSRITLSGLLNALDGVAAQEGRILYATTNRYSALDPALCRPGRMDLHVEFKLASKYQARELFKCFYLPPGADENEQSSKSSKSSSSSSQSSSRSGSPSRSSSRLSSTTVAEDSETTSEKPAQLYVGTRHRAEGPRLEKEEVLDLAERFADAIPEGELSMASLQGYLMSFKIRPIDAVDSAAEWVEKERADRARKSKKAHTRNVTA